MTKHTNSSATDHTLLGLKYIISACSVNSCQQLVQQSEGNASTSFKKSMNYVNLNSLALKD